MKTHFYSPSVPSPIFFLEECPIHMLLETMASLSEGINDNISKFASVPCIVFVTFEFLFLFALVSVYKIEAFLKCLVVFGCPYLGDLNPDWSSI